MDEKINKENEKAMQNIEKGLDNVVSGYIREFINKFDNFSNQIRIADILLKAYEYRYDKILGKVGNVNDIISYNYQNHKNFIDKCAKLSSLENKMTTIEMKLNLINEKIVLLLVESKKENEVNNNQSEVNSKINSKCH